MVQVRVGTAVGGVRVSTWAAQVRVRLRLDGEMLAHGSLS